MRLISIIILIGGMGAVLWIINSYVKIKRKRTLNIIVVIIVILWLANIFDFFGNTLWFKNR